MVLIVAGQRVRPRRWEEPHASARWHQAWILPGAGSRARSARASYQCAWLRGAFGKPLSNAVFAGTGNEQGKGPARFSEAALCNHQTIDTVSWDLAGQSPPEDWPPSKA